MIEIFDGQKTPMLVFYPIMHAKCTGIVIDKTEVKAFSSWLKYLYIEETHNFQL